jgi:hypothetical protein|tara:strand:- start:424 stop:549 length:126 start_codon:yes stop_codon:yes gene_type:complete
MRRLYATHDWDDAHADMSVTRAATRAEEEYSKAVIADAIGR